MTTPHAARQLNLYPGAELKARIAEDAARTGEPVTKIALRIIAAYYAEKSVS